MITMPPETSWDDHQKKTADFKGKLDPKLAGGLKPTPAPVQPPAPTQPTAPAPAPAPTPPQAVAPDAPTAPTVQYNPNQRTDWDDRTDDLYNRALGAAASNYDARQAQLDADQSTGSRRAASISAMTGQSGLGGGAMAGQTQANLDSNLLRQNALADLFKNENSILNDWGNYLGGRAQDAGNNIYGAATTNANIAGNLANTKLAGDYDLAGTNATISSNWGLQDKQHDWLSGENALDRSHGLKLGILNSDIEMTPDMIQQITGQEPSPQAAEVQNLQKEIDTLELKLEQLKRGKPTPQMAKEAERLLQEINKKKDAITTYNINNR